MALLGGDKFEPATGLFGRFWDATTRTFGSVVGRGGVRARAWLRALKQAQFPLPAWLKPVVAWCEPVLGSCRRSLAVFGRDGAVGSAVVSWFARDPVVKFISKSLVRRILISNLLGFAILFVGILYLSLDSGWVITAKRDSLRIQGQIIAAAIAGDAKITGDEFTLDPDTLPSTEAARVPLRDDGFAALELSLQPQHVAPILNRLIEPIKTRARIYDRSGTLVVDSSMLLRSGQIIGTNARLEENSEQPRTKNFWTRLQHWLIDKEVQVYKEIGTANGRYYPEVRSALSGTPEAMLLLNRKGEQIVSMAVPIQRLGKVLGVLLLSTQPGEVDDILAEDREAIWPLAALAIVASIVTSLLMARTVAGPMKRLSDTAEAVSRDINAHQELPAYSHRKDEVGQMARAFGSMTTALFERIEASEKFAADVAHELKNPLTAASSTAQSLMYAKTEEQRDDLVEQIQDELNRLNRLITDVSSASRLAAELARQTPKPVRIDDVLIAVSTMFESKAEMRDCKVELDVPLNRFAQSYVVNGNEGRLAQVFTNLVDNALSFSPDGGTVRIALQRHDGKIEVRVDDEGPGIEDDKLGTIFTRFYTYRPTQSSSRGNNSGLGLSISSEIVSAHGGKIWAENRTKDAGSGRDGRVGARFVVRLPGELQQTTIRGG